MTGRLPMRTSRRGVIGGAATALLVSGCEAGTPAAEPPGGSASTARPSAAPDSTREGDPDSDLVDAVVAEVARAAGVVTAAARARVALRPELAAWSRLHRAHLTALEATAGPRADRVSGSREELRAVVRRREAALQRRLAEAAVAARSGALASLLAVMSAGVAQQLAVESAEGR